MEIQIRKGTKIKRWFGKANGQLVRPWRAGACTWGCGRGGGRAATERSGTTPEQKALLLLGTKLRKTASEGGETQKQKNPNFGQRRRKKGAQSGPNSYDRAGRAAGGVIQSAAGPGPSRSSHSRQGPEQLPPLAPRPCRPGGNDNGEARTGKDSRSGPPWAAQGLAGGSTAVLLVNH